MKKFLFLAAAAFTAFVSSAQQPATPAPSATPVQSDADVKFDKTDHDFGIIKEGAMATYEFTFTNTGKSPLILSNVQPSCGCTTPEWPKEPIAPGAKSKIKAMYNSIGRPGNFQKYITVKSNSKSGDITLTIKGNVVPTPPEPVSPVRNKITE